MEAEIAAVRSAGLSGVVLGASRPDGRLDVPLLRRLVAASAGLELVLHRCIDLTPDMGEALEEAVALGFHRILTSGGETTAEAGAARIGALVALSRRSDRGDAGVGGEPGECRNAEGAWHRRDLRLMFGRGAGDGPGGGDGLCASRATADPRRRSAGLEEGAGIGAGDGDQAGL